MQSLLTKPIGTLVRYLIASLCAILIGKGILQEEQAAEATDHLTDGMVAIIVPAIIWLGTLVMGLLSNRALRLAPVHTVPRAIPVPLQANDPDLSGVQFVAPAISVRSLFGIGDLWTKIYASIAGRLLEWLHGITPDQFAFVSGLIENAESYIAGKGKGAERKAWVVSQIPPDWSWGNLVIDTTIQVGLSLLRKRLGV